MCSPRSAAARAPSSLHAKCVVIDDAISLVGSANFTDRGQARNYEAGVLLHEAAFARRLGGQWWSLVEAGRLARWRG